MISDKIIKDGFVTKTLRAGTNKVFELQSEIAHEILQQRTGRLFANLEERKFGLDVKSEHYTVTVRILNYLRFQDIRYNDKLRSDLHLYNRTVWGVLYGETLPELKYGLTDEIREAIRKRLEAAGLQLTIDFGE
ncbi:hypothetical protein D0T49_03960 [Paludibacter sp. 221]|uniref:hypothetical protein n=1 Tax=Paludibacter sp. 221 TaxID=2302939 RepID=UPI0013D53CCF|nr:hypothetical protein [Paludibacter sp. 221]NDV46196.1 hypothetical protein [Paludibacter sp. 221]